MADRRPPIIWSPEALADLSDIWDYYATVAGGAHGGQDRMKSKKHAGYLKIIHLPDAAEMRCGRAYARSLRVRTFVFYRVKNDIAEIVRVLDGRRDLDEIFAHDPGEKP